MPIKMIAGVSLFALAGAAIGYSQMLCPDGQCQITGTPYGGALFGGVMGLAIMSAMSATGQSPKSPAPKKDDTPETDPDD